MKRCDKKQPETVLVVSGCFTSFSRAWWRFGGGGHFRQPENFGRIRRFGGSAVVAVLAVLAVSAVGISGSLKKMLRRVRGRRIFRALGISGSLKNSVGGGGGGGGEFQAA